MTEQSITKQALPGEARSHPPLHSKRHLQRSVGAGSVILILFLAYCYFIPRGAMWNADTRIFLAASIVDRGQVNIDPYAQYTGDKAAYNGHYYSDKAPGSSLMAVPVYLFVKLTLYQGKVSYIQLLDVSDAKRTDFLARYLMTLLLVGLPSALLGGLIFRFLAALGLGLRGRMLLTLGYGLGTIAFAFSTVFFGHQIAALLLFAAFYLLFSIRQGTLSHRHYITAGLLAGYAIITEYPAALIVGCLAFYAFYHRRNWRSIVLFGAGMLPSAAIVAVYDTLCFGGPLNQGYANLAGPEAFRVGQAQGLLGVTVPHLDALWQTTFGPYRGLFLLSPFLLLALPGFWLLFRQRAWRSETLLWLSIVIIYFLFTISYYAWDGGYSLGPRHFIPVLPFLILPIAAVLKQRGWMRNISVGLISVSIVIVALATAVYPLNDPRFDAPLTERVLPLLVGVQPDAAHPTLSFATIWSGFLEAPLLTHAQLDNNWGELFGLPGIWQLSPLCIGIAIVLARFWWLTRPKPDVHPQAAKEGSTLVVAASPENASPMPGAVDLRSFSGFAEQEAQDQTVPSGQVDGHADPYSSPRSAHPELPDL